MSTILSRIVLPKPDRIAPSDVYYHTNGAVSRESGALVIAKGNTVRFDSYFNAFFYPKYLRYGAYPDKAGERVRQCRNMRGKILDPGR